MATYSSVLAWKLQWIEEPGGYSLWRQKELPMTERLTLSLFLRDPTKVGNLFSGSSAFSKSNLYV